MMNEQEALWFLFKILYRHLLCEEELTDEENDILLWYEDHLNFPGERKEE